MPTMTRNGTTHPEETNKKSFAFLLTGQGCSVVHICGNLTPGRHSSRLPPLSSCLNLLVVIQDLG